MRALKRVSNRSLKQISALEKWGLDFNQAAQVEGLWAEKAWFLLKSERKCFGGISLVLFLWVAGFTRMEFK